jgi:inner membrane protein YidH
MTMEAVEVPIKHKASAIDLPDSTELALARTHLANERTLIAWIRTGVTLISFGFTTYEFFHYMRAKRPEEPFKPLIGPRDFALIIIAMGVLSLMLAMLHSWQIITKLKESYHGFPYSLSILVAAVISLFGIMTLIAIAFRQ